MPPFPRPAPGHCLAWLIVAGLAPATAAPVSGVDSPTVSAESARALPSGTGASAVGDGIDFGEAGRMVRLLEEAERNRAARQAAQGARSGVGRPATGDLPWEQPALGAKPRAGSAKAQQPMDERVIDDDGGGFAPPPVSRQLPVAADAGNAPVDLSDLASSEQRSTFRTAVRFIKDLLRNPLAWVVLVIIGAGTAIASASSRRGR